MKRELREIPIELLDEPELASRVIIDQARLDELAESIKLKGVLEPLLVKAVGTPFPPLVRLDCESEMDCYLRTGGRFRVMAGHRRLLACRIAFVKTAPCLLSPADYADEDMVMLEENMHREDVTAAEQGYWILTLVEKQKLTFAVARQLLRVKEEDHRKFYLAEAIRLELSASSMQFMVDNYKRDKERGDTFAGARQAHVDPGLPAREEFGPHCVLCGTRDATQNMVQVLAHYYHLNPIKKLLRDAGVEWYDAPKGE